MLNFQKPTLGDRQWVSELMKAAGRPGSEYTFANLFNWSDVYDLRIARYKDFLIIKSGGGEAHYMYPAGAGDVSSVIAELKAKADERKETFSLYGIPAACVESVQKQLGESYEIKPVRDNFDYIYTRESLATLSGKKLHGKRNHINRFLSLYPDWRLEPIDQSNIGDAWEMNVEWCRSQECVSHSLKKEGCAVQSAFDNYFELGLTGALLRTGDRVVAFTMGSESADNTFVVHIEKAFASVEGAYPMINREFVRLLPEKYEYINREDDVGDEGLRKAKESYRPAMMYERYVAVKKDG